MADPATNSDLASRAQAMWIAGAPAVDTHGAFRARLHLDAADELLLAATGASWFAIHVDGEFLLDGPTRPHPGTHEWSEQRLELPAGDHVIAAHVCDAGVATRLAPQGPAFFACRVQRSGKPRELTWKCAVLSGYRAQTRRVNPQLGWIEWCDTRALPGNWTILEFDDRGWGTPVPVELGTTQFTEPTIGPIRYPSRALNAYAEGKLVETFGYELDDPPARFLLRNLDPPRDPPPQGVWRRFDLDRVRLGRAAITIDAPPGSVIEIASAESLTSGRVAPHITLSAGASCNMDHFLARGGAQAFGPMESRGGRFVEVHVLPPPGTALDRIRFVESRFIERTYHDEPIGAFACDDETLNRIWRAGVETYRACSEDAIIDNPTRERGQWTGDAVVGMETASVAYADLRLARRALVAAARNAREGGLVSGLTPGHMAIPSYAAQWVAACVRFDQLTGERVLLEELFPAAEKNLAAYAPHVNADGLLAADALGWSFIDWGYARPPGPIDPAVNLHYLGALRTMFAWCQRLNRPADAYRDATRSLEAAIRTLIGEKIFGQLGYHVTVLALMHDLIDPARRRDAIAFIKRHILSCFPNDSSAPRLSDPSVADHRIITPYFAHFAMPVLIANGEIDFVLDQFRHCWGWMLSEGRTTCLEVFDTRWSHCHQWSACPTWQLSRYVLGLHPRFDRGENEFDLDVYVSSLRQVKGKLPLGDAAISVSWNRDGDMIDYHVQSPRPIRIRAVRSIQVPSDARTEFALRLPTSNSQPATSNSQP